MINLDRKVFEDSNSLNAMSIKISQFHNRSKFQNFVISKFHRLGSKYFHFYADDDIMARFEAVTDQEITLDVQNATPIATMRKRKWAMKIFESWLSEWRVRIDGPLKVLKEVCDFDKSDLNYCLKYFFCEVRKVSGEKYPPQTLKEMCALIQNHFNSVFALNISVFNDPEFRECREVLNSQMKKAAREGLVKPKKKAEVISKEDEEALWENGILGSENPKQLTRTLIFTLGLHLSLRASQEHRDLEFGPESQIVLREDENGDEYLQYCERVSKNKQYGLKHSRMEPKQTRIYALPIRPERCVVTLYKKYINHRPEMNGGTACKSFYLAAKTNYIDGPIWYKSSALGIHSIENSTKEVMKQLKNDQGNRYTNSSLRRTAKNRLISGGISAEVAEKKTGRISRTADASYIESNLYEKEMSSALYLPQTSSISIKGQNVPPIEKSFTRFSPTFHECNVTINNIFQQ